MPVISKEKYYEKKNQGIEITENDSIVFYGAIANAGDKSEDKYPAFFGGTDGSADFRIHDRSKAKQLNRAWLCTDQPLPSSGQSSHTVRSP